MAVIRLRAGCCLPVALALTACASSPPHRTEQQASPVAATSPAVTGAVAWPAAVRFDIESALPIFSEMRDNDALLASRFSASVDEDRLRYRASWSVGPGDALTAGQGEAAKKPAATRLGGQQLGQQVSLRLPELAGSPVSLGISTEFRNDLLVSGDQEFQQEQATLKWSPGPATMAVQWAGSPTPFSAGTALACDMRSTLRLPTRPDAGHSEGLTLHGGVCAVTADGAAYAGIDTGTWGVGYSWDRTDRTTEAVLSIIELAEAPGAYRNLSPGYHFAVSHRRDFGPVSADAHVSLREAPRWEYGLIDQPVQDVEGSLSTHTSFTWSLPHASLSANWANGVDRLWFTPESGTRSDRFGLALDLSRWIGFFVPAASPQLAMNWNWSQVRPPGERITGENALKLDVALNF